MHVPPRNAASSSSSASEHSEPQNVREVTLKAFSPSNEIEYPGFQLLSLSTPPSPSSHLPSVSTVACFYPDYSSVYSWRYLPLIVLTTITLVILRQRKLRSPSLPTHHRRSTLVQSFSISSLPSGVWQPGPHPPTPFSPDWSPNTPGFYAPRGHPPGSPTDELPKGSLRAPAAPTMSASSSLPSTPTFRATAIPRSPSGSSAGPSIFAAAQQHLPTGPAHLDADELGIEDDFPAYDAARRPAFRVKLDRGDDAPYAYHDDDDDGPPYHDGDDADGDELAFTFTLSGRRRRIAFWVPLLRFSGALPMRRGAGRRGLAPAPAGRRARRLGKRSFAKRIALDLVCILWPAAALWVGLALVFS